MESTLQSHLLAKGQCCLACLRPTRCREKWVGLTSWVGRFSCMGFRGWTLFTAPVDARAGEAVGGGLAAGCGSHCWMKSWEFGVSCRTAGRLLWGDMANSKHTSLHARDAGPKPRTCSIRCRTLQTDQDQVKTTDLLRYTTEKLV